MRSRFIVSVAIFVCAFASVNWKKVDASDFDVVIYGATPAGIAVAIPIARRAPERRIALVTPVSPNWRHDDQWSQPSRLPDL